MLYTNTVISEEWVFVKIKAIKGLDEIREIVKVSMEESKSVIEMFDVFDEKMIKIGIDSRENVHAKGLWHQTFQCWIVNHTISEGGSFLFQLRHKDKDTYPGLLDISCAGHLQAGEVVDDGVRELQEELGITVSIDELTYCGMIAEENFISTEIMDREFNHVFIHESNNNLEDYAFQKDEISGLYFVNMKEFQRLLNGEIDTILIEGIVMDEVLQTVRPDQRKVQGSDFTPNSYEYYQLIFNKIDSLL